MQVSSEMEIMFQTAGMVLVAGKSEGITKTEPLK